MSVHKLRAHPLFCNDPCLSSLCPELSVLNGRRRGSGALKAQVLLSGSHPARESGLGPDQTADMASQ